MRKIALFFSFVSLLANAQYSYKLSGYVKDSTSREALIGANIIIEKQHVTTNDFGFFSTNLPNGKQSVMVSYVGYKSLRYEIYLTADTLIIINLCSSNIIDEVVVTGNNNCQNRLNTNQTSLEILSSKTVSKLPVVMGESDITRTLTMLPGISFGSENANGYFVRGGSSDQNLILMDGVPVYNAYHLYGYFSIFNTDAINQSKIYKGGAPARYGGRLSSVLDLQMKEGNAQKYSGDITLGVVASKFLLEGPIINEKTSFIITGRRSMLDLLPKSIAWSFIDNTGINKANRNKDFDFFFTENHYLFSDLNLKVNHIFSVKSRLFFTCYTGNDKFENRLTYQNVNNFKKNNWGNLVLSARWNYVFNNNLFANFTIYRSQYKYQNLHEDYVKDTTVNQLITNSRQIKDSEIEDYSAKADFDYTINRHYFKFGVQYIQQKVKPGVSSFMNRSIDQDINIDTTYSFNKTIHSNNLYIEDNVKLFDKLNINVGIHVNSLFVDKYIYFNPQPRLSGSYQLFENTSFKASYARNVQCLHQLISNSLGDPSDLWVPVTRKIKPSSSHDFVLNLHHNFNSSYSLTVETFYKTMDNLITYKPGAGYISQSTNWEDMVQSGQGRAKGIELMINKESGNLTGWISYSLSKSERKYSLSNNNRWFPYTFDRRHNITVALMQKISKKIDMGANWVFATGNYVTLPNSYIDNIRIASALNNYRMPAYHRLDVCINFNNNFKYFSYKLSLGAYNLYNRLNPYQLIDGEEGWKVVGIFPILPYVSMSLKF